MKKKKRKGNKKRLICTLAVILTLSGAAYYIKNELVIYVSSIERVEPVDVIPEASAPLQIHTEEDVPTEPDTIAQSTASVSKETTEIIEQRKSTIKNVPHIYQMNDYPTGCESVSAVSLMRFYGSDIDVDEFIDEFLPCADYPYTANDGIMYAESPNTHFIGDPRSTHGFGCYSPVILKAMKKALPNGTNASTGKLSSLEELCKKYVSNGDPVMVWATMEMRSSYSGKSWVLPNGDMFTFTCPEHALLLIGFDEESYFFSDPMQTEDVVSYPKKSCEEAFRALGCQSIVISQK